MRPRFEVNLSFHRHHALDSVVRKESVEKSVYLTVGEETMKMERPHEDPFFLRVEHHNQIGRRRRVTVGIASFTSDNRKQLEEILSKCPSTNTLDFQLTEDMVAENDWLTTHGSDFTADTGAPAKRPSNSMEDIRASARRTSTRCAKSVCDAHIDKRKQISL